MEREVVMANHGPNVLTVELILNKRVLLSTVISRFINRLPFVR